ncbi:MAG: peroxiredoxin family protein [Thermodesulfobacteriota bacterium]
MGYEKKAMRGCGVAMLFLLLFWSPVALHAAWIGSTAPEFTLKDGGGRSVSLEQFRGRVVFINFWASWCGPCKKEFPALNAFINKYETSDAVVLAINIDKKRSHADKFLEEIPLRSPNMIVLFDPASRVVAAYKARAMPTSFVVDRDGRIRYLHFGFNKRDKAKWTSEVDSLLKAWLGKGKV